jgi:hypothetical protein
MWAAIKTDLTDFLTSASTETEQVLNSLDQTIDSFDEKLNPSDVEYNTSIDANDLYGLDYEESLEEEAMRLAGLIETFTEPLVVEMCLDDSKDVSYETNETSYESCESEEEEELFERQLVEQFLESFDLDSHTEEITRLLHPLQPVVSCEDRRQNEAADDENQTTATQDSHLTPLQIQYQQLVPNTMTHQQFWTRYYFRCNPTLISKRREHKRYLAERKRQMDLRVINEAARNIGKTAASLFKNVSGAMGAVSESLGEATRGVAYASGAMEDDDDEYIEGEEEASGVEEEASLGWGSDSEDEEVSIEHDDDDDSFHDEVAFGEGSPAPHTPLKLESLDVVKLRRTLMHAESERNNLMQMVEERNEEIVRLKYALEEKHSKRDDELLDKLRKEVECLRTAAALKNARATISNLQMKIEEANEANESSTMNRLIRDECNNHNVLQSKIDEYKEKIEQLQKQTKEADERISQM